MIWLSPGYLSLVLDLHFADPRDLHAFRRVVAQVQVLAGLRRVQQVSDRFVVYLDVADFDGELQIAKFFRRALRVDIFERE